MGKRKGKGKLNTAMFKSIHPASYATDVVKGLSTLQKDDMYTDFHIQVSGKTIKCHKVLLAAMCPYFSSLLGSGMQEAQQGEVKLDDMDFDVTKSIISYLYGNDISFKEDEIQPAIEACDFLQIQSLKDQLAAYVVPSLSPTNCIGWYKFALKFGLRSVEDKAKDIMHSQGNQVMASEEFKNLSVEELKLFYVNDAGMDRDPLLVACMEWVRYQPEGRKETLRDLLEAADLGECSSLALNMITTKYDDLIDDVDLKECVYKAIIPILHKEKELCKKHIVLLGGSAGYNSDLNPKCWFLEDFDWTEMMNIPQEYRACQSTIVVLPDGFVVMCGGQTFDRNTRYNLITKSWEELPQFPKSHMRDVTAVYSCDTIYILGGEINNTMDAVKQDTVYQLDLKLMKWKKGSNMLAAQVWPIAAFLGNDELFVVFNDDGANVSTDYSRETHTNTLQYIQKGQNKWQYKEPVPDGTFTSGACLLQVNNKLHLVGGQGKICCQYTPATNTWQVLVPPPRRHWYGAAVYTQGKIYLAGGLDEKDAIDIYNIEKNEWKECPQKLPEGLAWATMAMMPLPSK